MNGYCESILGTIGNTPLVELRKLGRTSSSRVLAKLETVNPGASKKDRVALQIVQDARASGALKPGQMVVELTSGNTGTGLAIVCKQLGHPFVAVMSRGNSIERAQMMRAYGAEVELVDQHPDSVMGQVSGPDLELVEQRTQQLVRERSGFRADQFNTQSNFRAHYLHTGPEILQQSPYPIDVFCDFAGTGGTFAGVAAALKERRPETKCYLVEPEKAAAISGAPVTNPKHRIQGGGYVMPNPPLINRAHVDGFVTVSDDEAISSARALAREEGIFAGFSSGANLAAALKLLEKRGEGTAVIMICDSGLKYMSTELWREL